MGCTDGIPPLFSRPQEGDPATVTVEYALHATDTKNAGHWHTVVGVLADEVRRLRAAVDRPARRSPRALAPNETAGKPEVKMRLSDVIARLESIRRTEGDLDNVVEVAIEDGVVLVEQDGESDL